MRRLSTTRKLLTLVGMLLAPAVSAAEPSLRSLPPKDWSAHIDYHIERRWREAAVTPAPLADDAELCRRIHLDIVGRLPSPADIRKFLASTDPDKRRRLVDELLASPAYAGHFAAYWREVMVPEALINPQLQALVFPFEHWLQDRLARDMPYNEMVEELLTAPLFFTRQGATAGPAASPMLFFAAKELTPENLAAGTARAFFSLRIECAQCHDHPFDDWKREEFWGFAAFFAGIGRGGPGTPGRYQDLFDRRELMVPNTTKVVQASYLDRTRPRWQPREGARVNLARWATATENPYFARATVNRLWDHFFGHGLVDPVDDFSRLNPASHPELLDELARWFAYEGFDLKDLIRGITGSTAYRLSSRRTDAGQDHQQLFARMPLRGLSSFQLRSCLEQATGETPGPSSELISTAGSASPGDQQVGILFALALRNGPEVARATDPKTGRVPAALASLPISNAERIDELYLLTLSRFPTPTERARAQAHLSATEPTRGLRSALADLLWMLLNSSELLINH